MYLSPKAIVDLDSTAQALQVVTIFYLIIDSMCLQFPGLIHLVLQALGAMSSLLVASGAAASSATDSAAVAPAYAQSSYYATLGLFVITFPGLWSLVKRSVAYSPIRKTYVTSGPQQGKEVRSKRHATT